MTARERWAYFDFCFTFLCILITTGLVCWCIYEFSLDEDETMVSFKRFHDRKLDVQPLVSMCISDPYETTELKKYNSKITSNDYSDFLGGIVWNVDMLRINYSSVVVSPIRYILGYEITYKNATRSSIELNPMDEENGKNAILPNTRTVLYNMVCFGLDIPSKDVMSIAIKIRTDIFQENIRPIFTRPNTKRRGLAIMFHYPNQSFRSKWWINYWPNRSVNASKNYMISIGIGGMEVVYYRNKRQQRCKDGLPDYDHDILQEVVSSVGCTPPYIASYGNQNVCSNQAQMRLVNEKIMDHFSGDNHRHLPCRGIERISYATTESDMKQTTPPYFTITYKYGDLTYKEIRLKRAYTVQSLVGNVGGFIGLFLGYTIVMIPGCLKWILEYLQNYIQ